MAVDEGIREQAITWAVRTGEPGFDDWETFTAWLETDPSHVRAYDEVTAAVADGAEALRPMPLAQNDDEPGLFAPRRRWLGGWRSYYAAPYGPYYIWGATARVLHSLAQRLAA